MAISYHSNVTNRALANSTCQPDSVIQSSFAQPCQPLNAASFFSGFFPTAEGQNPEVFQIVVQDKNPIWYYCGQTAGSHCQNGMG